jgi:uncharacterized protein YxeA
MKKLFMMMCMLVAMFALAGMAYAETRTYTEMVTVKVDDDEYAALNKAKERAREQALRSYLNDVYKDRSSTLNLTGDDKFVQDWKWLKARLAACSAKSLPPKSR